MVAAVTVTKVPMMAPAEHTPKPLVIDRTGTGTTGVVEKGVTGVNGYFCDVRMVIDCDTANTATVTNVDTSEVLATGKGLANGQIVLQWLDLNSKKPAPFKLTLSAGGTWSYRVVVIRGKYSAGRA